ncbi:MAG: transcription antitermination factor NusB [Actinomycetota bacterium]|nr:transcription antitermination factor NusB [Actinomycetota bacterium]
MVKGTVRYRIFIDYCISQLSHVSLNQLDTEVVTILRLGVFQILYLTRFPMTVLLMNQKAGQKICSQWCSQIYQCYPEEIILI